MFNNKKRFISFFTSLIVLFSLFVGNFTDINTTEVQAAVYDYDLADNMKDGAILHAWCWSFNTIKNNMKDIAAAGYTSVQTSPANACVVGNGGDLRFTNQWWYHYQPTNYTIGNYQLGTKDEFKAMCDEAEKYGVNIIVDVVANHMTSDWSKINSSWQNRSLFHGNTSIKDWNSRWDITQNALLSLWDLNTQSGEVQNKIKSYLQDCVANGADGFRYDAAKHIELPDDSGFGGNFWPTILSNGSEFQYGEILQDGISREGAYASYMSVTASSYGKKLRDSVSSKNFNAGSLGNWDIGVNSSKLVTWVESHDNYANAPTDWGSSAWMNDWQVKMSWAVVAARAGGAPLFFSRPVGGGSGNRFPEVTKIGDKGSDLFKDAEVVAVNKFRNAMVGQNEYLRNYGGNDCLLIERGNKGITIINLGGEKQINSATNLANGTYKDQVSGSTFTVSNGTLTGKVSSGKIAVIYNAVVESAVSSSKASTTYANSLQLTLGAKNVTSATYSIDGSTPIAYVDGASITIGQNKAVGSVTTLTLDGKTSNGDITATYSYTKTENISSGIARFIKPSNWGTPKAYVYDDSSSTVKEVAKWPGVAMIDQGNSVYSYTLPEGWTTAKIIFTDGSNQLPASGQPGFVLNVGESKIYKDNSWMDYKEGNPISNVTKIYFRQISGWAAPKIYVYDDSTSTVKKIAEWPGVAMTSEGNNLFSYTLPEDWTRANVIFTDGSKQIPEINQPGFEIIKGQIKIYENGVWLDYKL